MQKFQDANTVLNPILNAPRRRRSGALSAPSSEAGHARPVITIDVTDMMAPAVQVPLQTLVAGALPAFDDVELLTR